MLKKLTNVLIHLDITLTLPHTIHIKKGLNTNLACKQVILCSFTDHNTVYVSSHSLTFSIPEREMIWSVLSQTLGSRPHMWLPDVQMQGCMKLKYVASPDIEHSCCGVRKLSWWDTKLAKMLAKLLILRWCDLCKSKRGSYISDSIQLQDKTYSMSVHFLFFFTLSTVMCCSFFLETNVLTVSCFGQKHLLNVNVS